MITTAITTASKKKMLKCIKKTSLSFPYPLSVEIVYGLAYFLSTKSISLSHIV